MPDSRTVKLTAVAIALHALMLVAVQTGLARRVLAPDATDAVIAELFAPDPAPRAAPPEPQRPREAPAPVRIARPVAAPTPAPVPAPRPEPGVEAVRQTVDAAHAATVDAASAPASPAAAATPARPASRPDAADAPAPGPAVSSAPRAVQFGEIQCSTPEPQYPLISKRTGEQGTARVRLVIDASGTTERVELAASSGFDRLDRVALEAAQATRCRPYLADGRPVRVTAVRPFAFRLD